MHFIFAIPCVLKAFYVTVIVSGFQLNVSEEKQVGSVFLGAGALKEKKAYSLTKLTSRQREKLEDARKYAREQGIKAALLKQTITHQQQVN